MNVRTRSAGRAHGRLLCSVLGIQMAIHHADLFSESIPDACALSYTWKMADAGWLSQREHVQVVPAICTAVCAPLSWAGWTFIPFSNSARMSPRSS